MTRWVIAVALLDRPDTRLSGTGVGVDDFNPGQRGQRCFVFFIEHTGAVASARSTLGHGRRCRLAGGISPHEKKPRWDICPQKVKKTAVLA